MFTLFAIQAAQQLAAEQEADLRSRATAMLQADMPQEALESLMRDVFRSADTGGSGALSRKVRDVLSHIRLVVHDTCYICVIQQPDPVHSVLKWVYRSCMVTLV
jgi:hypothetical protein